MKLILIHGRDQQGKDRAALQKAWERALDEGFEEAELDKPRYSVAFPFYGDELDRLVKVVDAPLVKDVAKRRGAPDTNEADFRGALLEELAENASISKTTIAQHYKGDPKEKGPLNWGWVQAVLRALDTTPLGEKAIDRFTRDVYVYLTYDLVSRTINKIVTDKIDREPCVVVAHSLGTIVAYRVLRDLGPGFDVRRLITVGSPLGVEKIRDHITPPALAMPSSIPSWFNAYDDRDVVALRALDKRTWPIKPPITNKRDVDNDTKNRHGIIGYLDDPVVAKWIYDGLTS